MDFYNLTINSPQGKIIRMSDFKGKIILIVNTATKCGLSPQFDGLEKIHQLYEDKGVVVLGFPCNQFGGQEPETNDSVEESCRINFGVTFQLTEKIDVNGDNTHPIFEHLKNNLGGFFGKKIKWNFTKFIVDKNGRPYKRYSPTKDPMKLINDIEALLKN